MPLFNVINPEEVGYFLIQQAERNDQLARLLLTTLRRALLREPKAMEKVLAYPENPPAWLTKAKFQTDGPFHWFSQKKFLNNPGLERDLSHVVDWLKAALNNGEPWIHEKDGQGRIKALANVGTLAHARNLADKAMRRAREKRLREAGAALFLPLREDPSLRIVETLPNGFSWVQLLTPEALDREGLMMGHCVGDGAYDEEVLAGETCVYSLRGPNGRSHATLEVWTGDSENTGRFLEQCRGKGDAPPAARYLPMVKAFVLAQGFDIGRASAAECGLVQDEAGRLYDVENLPEKMKFKGELDISEYPHPFALPKKLFSDGLVVRGSAGLCRALGNWDISGRIVLNDCPNLVRAAGLWRATIIDLRGCPGLTRLEGDFASGYLCLKGCTGLTSLPRNLWIGEKIVTDAGRFETVEKARAALGERRGGPSSGIISSGRREQPPAAQCTL